MNTVAAWLPATALVALLIFVAKEMLEVARRSSAERRRKEALRALLARECELNHWAIQSLRRIAGGLKGLVRPASEAFRIEFAKSGRVYACVDDEEGGAGFKIPLPVVHKVHLQGSLLDIATLDKKLFVLAEAALTAIAELEHVREGFLYHGSAEDEEEREHADGFAEYAIGELEDAFVSISALYKECTGAELSGARIR